MAAEPSALVAGHDLSTRQLLYMGQQVLQGGSISRC